MASSKEIGRRIRRLRVERGLAQREVAEPELTAAYLSLIESGQRFPSPSALEVIAERLGVTTDEVLTGRSADLYARLELALQESRQLMYEGDLEAAERRLKELRSEARRHSMQRFEARIDTALGAIEERRGRISDARVLYEEAERLFAEDPPHVRVEATVGVARCSQYLEDPQMAIHILEMYLRELDTAEVPDPTARMRALSSMVHLYKIVDLERRAIECAVEAQRLAAHVDDPEQIACMNMNVARALLEQGRHEDALDALRTAERTYEQLGWPIPRVRSMLNRGIVEASKGALDRASETFSGVVRVLQGYPEQTSLLGEALNELGRVQRLVGDDEAAIDTLKRARKLLAEDDVFEQASNQRELGRAFMRRDAGRAERELRASARTFQAAGARREAGESLLELGRLLRQQGEIEKALKILEQGLELTTSIS